MQIHEITESKLKEAGALGSFLSGITGGMSDKYTNKSADNSAPVAKKVISIWNNYATQLKAATPDPARYDALYKQTLTAFVQKNLLGGQSINTATNKPEINQLIANISVAKDNPEQVAQLMAKLVQQGTLSKQDVTQSQTLTKVVSTDPAVIQYRNVTYIINDNGQWADQKTGKEPDQSFQAFMDQELIKAGGSAPTPSAPVASTHPEPRRVSRTRGGR